MNIYVLRYDIKHTEDLFCYKNSETNVLKKISILLIYLYNDYDLIKSIYFKAKKYRNTIIKNKLNMSVRIVLS